MPLVSNEQDLVVARSVLCSSLCDIIQETQQVCSQWSSVAGFCITWLRSFRSTFWNPGLNRSRHGYLAKLRRSVSIGDSTSSARCNFKFAYKPLETTRILRKCFYDEFLVAKRVWTCLSRVISFYLYKVSSDCRVSVVAKR